MPSREEHTGVSALCHRVAGFLKISPPSLRPLCPPNPSLLALEAAPQRITLREACRSTIPLTPSSTIVFRRWIASSPKPQLMAHPFMDLSSRPVCCQRPAASSEPQLCVVKSASRPPRHAKPLRTANHGGQGVPSACRQASRRWHKRNLQLRLSPPTRTTIKSQALAALTTDT
ncbi:hypothetical protein CC80DRAFT_208923 [Byssothecium circinans]|uniref:Uncharacterized protein n=1 Tax=Byssothecium circinans TaxID=147558 RepID=A0A6A5TGK0_9PLEO|nr:hypothetical protein CC80DRAFT_208923 [Byssothecium circinans]